MIFLIDSYRIIGIISMIQKNQKSILGVSMKKIVCIILAVAVMCAMVIGCGSSDEGKITSDMAYEGVSNYCQSEYGFGEEGEHADLMTLEMGEETDTEYVVVFHSYTDALVNFYVNKETGTTRIVEYVPALDKEEEAGTIELSDYLG